jgi:hypothetical protein
VKTNLTLVRYGGAADRRGLFGPGAVPATSVPAATVPPSSGIAPARRKSAPVAGGGRAIADTRRRARSAAVERLLGARTTSTAANRRLVVRRPVRRPPGVTSGVCRDLSRSAKIEFTAGCPGTISRIWAAIVGRGVRRRDRWHYRRRAEPLIKLPPGAPRHFRDEPIVDVDG